MTRAQKWILVANRSSAKLYRGDSAGLRLDLVRHVDHPEGRLKDSEIVSDREGRTFTSFQGNPGRHGLEPPVLPAEHEANRFAKELARLLREGRVRDEYEELVLVAEPSFLGRLRASLDPSTSKRVERTINREVIETYSGSVEDRLRELFKSV